MELRITVQLDGMDVACGRLFISPAFDINPTAGDGEKYLSCAADFDERLAAPSTALTVCEAFRMPRQKARDVAHGMARVLASWRNVAGADGISRQSISLMESCFESGIERLATV